MSQNAWLELAFAALWPAAGLLPVLVLTSLRWAGLLLACPLLTEAGLTVRLRLALAFLLGMAMLPAGANSPAISGIQGLPQLAISGLNELVLGAALGWGIHVVISGLRLTGELFDNQVGTAIGQVFEPYGETGAGGRLLVWWGAAVFLTIAPAGGDLILLGRLLELFRVLPPGSSTLDSLGGAVPAQLLQQTLLIALTVAAPLLAAMSLVTLIAGWFGRSQPQLACGPLVLPIRVMVSLALLAAVSPSISEWLSRQFDALLDWSPVLPLQSG